MQGSGKVKFDASAGFMMNGEIFRLWSIKQNEFYKDCKTKKGILYHLKIEQASDLKIPTKGLALVIFMCKKIG